MGCSGINYHKSPIQNGLILPTAAPVLAELSAAVPDRVAEEPLLLLVDVDPLEEVIPLAVEFPVPVADAVELLVPPVAAPDDALDDDVVSVVQLAVKKT
jgi:hypothetical protein